MTRLWTSESLMPVSLWSFSRIAAPGTGHGGSSDDRQIGLDPLTIAKDDVVGSMCFPDLSPKDQVV